MPNIQEHIGARRINASVRVLSTFFLAAALVAAGGAQAAEKSMPAAPAAHAGAGPHAAYPINQKKFEAFQKTRGELEQLRGKLNKIQAATLKAHPELVKQMTSFENLVAATMKKNGFDSKKEITELQSLQAKLRDKNTPKDQQQALVMKFQSKVMALRKAQYEALQDKKVQKARQELGDAVVGAMKKQDPKTGKLLAMVQEKEKELIKLRLDLVKEAKKEVAGAQAKDKAKAK